MTGLPKPLRSLLRWALLWLALAALSLVALGWGLARAQDHHPFHREFYRQWKQPATLRLTNPAQNVALTTWEWKPKQIP